MKQSPILRALTRTLTLTAAVAVLAGCESIGQGNKLESMEIVTASGRVNTDGTYRVYECFRDALALRGTFTDDTVGSFTNRAKWTSSNPDVVRVANDEEQLISPFKPSDDEPFDFNPVSRTFYSRGTLIPVNESTEPVTITAEFVGFKKEIKVEVRAMDSTTLSISRSPLYSATPATATLVNYLGVDTRQDFTLQANLDGEIVDAAAAGSFDAVFNSTLNPVKWTFLDTQTPAQPIPAEEVILNNGADGEPGTDDDIVELRVYTQNDATNDDDEAYLNPLSGFITAQKAEAREIKVRANLAPCDVNVEGKIQVANFARNNPVTIAYEPGFENGNLVLNTNQLIGVTANLEIDTDSNGTPDTTVTQDIGGLARFDVQPDDEVCTETSSGETCANSVFTFAVSPANLLQTVPGTVGGSAAIKGCFAIYKPTASLSATQTTGSTTSWDFDASSFIHPDRDVKLRTYTFDFGDDSAVVTQSSPKVPHNYTKEGLFTATVTVTDGCNGIGQNEGAAQIVVGAPPSNTAPTAALTVSNASGTAPLTVTFDASGSDPKDSDDKIAVYTFNFGDGSPVVHSADAKLSHVYREQPTAPPSVTVTDTRGDTSAAETASVSVTGTATVEQQSNELALKGIAATLDDIKLCPNDTSTTPPTLDPSTLVCNNPSASQPAFTFPGLQFEAVGVFSHGRQKITRFMTWFARPKGSETEFSDIAAPSNAFLQRGRMFYFENVDPEEPETGVKLDIHAIPGAPFDAEDEPTAAELTVLPCIGTCPEPPPAD